MIEKGWVREGGGVGKCLVYGPVTFVPGSPFSLEQIHDYIEFLAPLN